MTKTNRAVTRRSVNKLTLGAAALGTMGAARRPSDDPGRFTSKKYKHVNGLNMAYVEVGEGDPIVFIHGNPSSSYLWRNIIPYAEPFGRCIAVDLIGMGDSDKLPGSGPDRYTYVEHRKYLDGLMAALNVNQNVTFVVHDWGGPLGFGWANQHRNAVKALAFMETIVRASDPDSQTDANTSFPMMFQKPEMETNVLENNFFVEQLMLNSLEDVLSEEDKAAYRAPYLDPGESRRPTIDWPRQLLIKGEPREVYDAEKAYGDWLLETELPKLFIIAEPGTIVDSETAEYTRQFKNQTEVTVQGRHWIQEESPDEIGQALADWLETLS